LSSEFGDIRGGMVPAFQVGGDVYDFYFNDDRRLAFVVADASGKGLPAAILITRMCKILRAASRRIGDPAQCLTLLNEGLCFDNPDLMFVTAFYGILDTATGEVVFANAGHNPPVHVKPDGPACAGGEVDRFIGSASIADDLMMVLLFRNGLAAA
jgi:sigma-B regulation protein RsbU (phosphoserine phosphatase)